MRNRSVLISLLALVGALALVAAGCGGDDGDSTESSGGEPLSKEEFIKQADAICESGDAEIEQKSLALPDDVSEDELVGTVIVPGTRAQVDQIRALVPPEGDEDAINEFLDTFDRGLDELENDPSILANPETIVEARGLAKEYGFKECDEGGSANARPGFGVEQTGTGPKAKFIAQADQICATTAQKTAKQLKGVTDPAEVADVTATGIEDQVDQIRILAIPQGDEDEVNAILDAAAAGAEGIREDPGSLQSGGVPNDDLQEANDLAVAYGLTVCGS